jgi:hypothetical protein
LDKRIKGDKKLIKLTILYGNDSAKYQAGRITYDPLFGILGGK